MATIYIPTPLRPYTGDDGTVSVGGDTVGEALSNLIQQYPQIEAHLFDDGNLRSFVNIFLREENINFLDGIDTIIEEDDQIVIVPSLAGGCCKSIA